MRGRLGSFRNARRFRSASRVAESVASRRVSGRRRAAWTASRRAGIEAQREQHDARSTWRPRAGEGPFSTELLLGEAGGVSRARIRVEHRVEIDIGGASRGDRHRRLRRLRPATRRGAARCWRRPGRRSAFREDSRGASRGDRHRRRGLRGWANPWRSSVLQVREQRRSEIGTAWTNPRGIKV